MGRGVTLDIAVTGDLVLDEPDAEHWLSGIAPALQAADLAIGHLEVPHTSCREQMTGDIPAPGAPPENIGAIARAGFGMVSLAGNHIADCGPIGIADTIDALEQSGIAHTGAGPDLAYARTPAVVEVDGCRIALLSYNCVGPEEAWARADRAGCAYLPLGTSDGSPVSPRADIDRLLPEAEEILRHDIGKADADTVIVALHKGIVHTPVRLAPYERPLARAAIECGADAVIAHHSHIARGIEFIDGRPVFHGLGNGCVVTRALAPEQDNPARREWARRRREMFGFEPDPAYHLAPFHPEAVNAFIGRLSIAADGRLTAGVVPVFVEPPGRPVLAGPDRIGDITGYLEAITEQAGLAPILIASDGTVSPAP